METTAGAIEKNVEQSEKRYRSIGKCYWAIGKRYRAIKKRLPEQSEKSTEESEKVKSKWKRLHNWSSKRGRLPSNKVCDGTRMHRHNFWVYRARVLMLASHLWRNNIVALARLLLDGLKAKFACLLFRLNLQTWSSVAHCDIGFLGVVWNALLQCRW